MKHPPYKMERSVHGSPDYAELASLGLHPQELIDLSVNTHPYGPSPHVWEAVARVAIDRYPDHSCLELKQAILHHEMSTTNLTLDALVCGNGTTELIWTIARACLGAGMKAAVIGPTFGEYRAASLAAGATVIEYRARASKQFQPDVEEAVAWIKTESPHLVWLCNPNNPTGIWLDRAQIVLLVQACQQTEAILVVDEAYWRFVFPAETFSAIELIGSMPGLKIIALRSLTKDYALAGLRLGYAVTSVEIARLLDAHLPSWNVNAMAQVAGVAALSDREHLATTLEALMIERRMFFDVLEQRGLMMVPSRTHFCLLDVKHAYAVRQRLLSRNVLVRDATSFGLPYAIRISTRSREEWQRFLIALQEVL